MNITHLGHACVLVEVDGVRVLIDPGTFSEGVAELADIDAVLITHQHFDHVDLASLTPVLEASPTASLVVEQATAATLVGSIANDRVQIVGPGDRFDVRGIDIEVVGGAHAVIHCDIDVIPNVGYYFDRQGFLHPGDDFSLPAVDVDVLALPISGPWQKLSDTVDYLRAVNPRVAVPIHEAVTSRPTLFHNYLQNLKPSSTQYQVLDPGLSTEIPQ